MASTQDIIKQLQEKYPRFMRPEQVQKLPNLDANSKANFEHGFRTCWQKMAEHAAQPEGAEFKNAYQKLQNATNKVIGQYQQWKNGSQGRTQPEEQSQQTSQPSQPPQQLQQTQQPQAPPLSQPQPQHSQQALTQAPQISQEIMQNANNFPVAVPLNMMEGSAEAKQYIQDKRLQYGQALAKANSTAMQVKSINAELVRRRQAGQEQGIPQLEQQKQQAQKEHAAVTKWLENFRSEQAQINKARVDRDAKQRQQQQQQPQQPGEPQVKVEPGHQQQQQQQQHSMSMNPGMPQGFNLQLPAGRNPQKAAETPIHNPNVQAVRNNPLSMGSPMSPVTSVPPTQQLPPSQQTQPPHNAAIHPPSQLNNPIRPPLNTQQPSHLSQISHSPHSANPNGPPMPLSHSAAMAAAQSGRTNSQQFGTPQQQQQMPQQIPQGYHAREPNNKPFPQIQRSFQAPSPQPVNMGPGRPTMGGATQAAPGMLGQPAIAKPAHFTIEGEGERVLSRRKLQELVRQVAAGEGPSGEYMSPEVEESILELADEFIDNVTTAACRVAKTRSSGTLEIRDIQMVLERNYNIRIPGYSADDVRTVRKFQPAAAWQQKMNAVQAAKVMGGKTDI